MRTLSPSAGSVVTAIADAARRPGELLEPAQLMTLATAVAGAEADWRPLLRHDPERRWYMRLYASPEVEVWLLAWSAHQDTSLHDHGGACGAFHVVEGALTEDYVHGGRTGVALRRRRHRPGGGVAFGPSHIHDVANPGPDVATSIHAYSPALTTMGFYEPGDAGELVATARIDVGGPDAATSPVDVGMPAATTSTVDVGMAPDAAPTAPRGPAPRQSVDALLAAARGRLRRLTAREAAASMAQGALLVDIRPRDQRRAHGEVPGAIVIDRNVLEWRLDPTSDSRIPEATYDRNVVVLCQQGFASSLAAATLQELGVVRATDVAGGFEAWAAAGLPVERR